MTETETKIREVFVDISSLLFVSRSWLIAKLRVLIWQPCVLRTVWLCLTRYLVISLAVI